MQWYYRGKTLVKTKVPEGPSSEFMGNLDLYFQAQIYVFIYLLSSLPASGLRVDHNRKHNVRHTK